LRALKDEIDDFVDTEMGIDDYLILGQDKWGMVREMFEPLVGRLGEMVEKVRLGLREVRREAEAEGLRPNFAVRGLMMDLEGMIG
jgi:hypothetical protein